MTKVTENPPAYTPQGITMSGMENKTQATAVTECEQLVSRLKRAEGQVRAVINLLETGSGCSDVTMQMAAAKRAMDKASMALALRLADLARAGNLSPEEFQRLALSLA